jgi:hypothetical protein
MANDPRALESQQARHDPKLQRACAKIKGQTKKRRELIKAVGRFSSLGRDRA